MSDDNDLVQALRDAGHDDVADGLEHKLAGGAPAPVEPPPADAAARQQAEGEAFVEELRGALNRGKTKLPGLLDQ
jgi:hypothetical protein